MQIDTLFRDPRITFDELPIVLTGREIHLTNGDLHYLPKDEDAYTESSYTKIHNECVKELTNFQYIVFFPEGKPLAEGVLFTTLDSALDYLATFKKGQYLNKVIIRSNDLTITISTINPPRILLSDLRRLFINQPIGVGYDTYDKPPVLYPISDFYISTKKIECSSASDDVHFVLDDTLATSFAICRVKISEPTPDSSKVHFSLDSLIEYLQSQSSILELSIEVEGDYPFIITTLK